jgi:hypothetical protein
LLCARFPSDDELRLLASAHRRFLKQYQSGRAAALELLSVGETPRDISLPVEEHAAMTLTASLMMNLDETITKQ